MVEWWKDGNLHRDDGPAIERANGHKEWWKNGRHIKKLTRYFPLKILVEYGVLTPIQVAKERLKLK